MHKRQGKYQCGGKTHNSHRKENYALKILEIVEIGRGQFCQESGIDLCGIEGKKHGENDGRNKAGGNTGLEAIAVIKFHSFCQPLRFDSFIDPKTGNNTIEKTVKYIRM